MKTNQDTMTVNLNRLEVCDLMMACTIIEIEAKEEWSDPNTSKSRREVLYGTIKKWSRLHDTLEAQLKEFDEQ